MVLIAVTNQSTLVSNNDAATMCAATQKQVTLHVAPAYNAKTCTVKFYADPKKIPGHSWLINIIDDDTSVPGALGYHSEQDDKVIGFIMCKPVLDNGGVVLYDANNPQNVSVASVLSHETLEIFADRYAGFWADGPTRPQGTEYALEICDPVEGDSYVIEVNGVKVSVSNFVFPAWFNMQASSPQNLPFDYLKKLSEPFSMTAGGYMILRANGQANQIFGDNIPGWKKEAKMKSFARGGRRSK